MWGVRTPCAEGKFGPRRGESWAPPTEGPPGHGVPRAAGGVRGARERPVAAAARTVLLEAERVDPVAHALLLFEVLTAAHRDGRRRDGGPAERRRRDEGRRRRKECAHEDEEAEEGGHRQRKEERGDDELH